MRVQVPALPEAVEAELERLEGRLLQFDRPEARHHLAELGEAGAARVLRTIWESQRVRTLSGFIRYMANQERMKHDARGVPTDHSAACVAGASREEEFVSMPLYNNEDHMDVQSPNSEIASGLPNHTMVEIGSPNQPMQFQLHGNGGSVRQIARLVPEQARLTVESPCGQISSVLQNQNYIDVDAPAQAMASPVSNYIEIDSPVHCMPSGLPNYVEIDSLTQPMISTRRRASTPSPVRDLSVDRKCYSNKIENVLSVDYIISLKFMPMAQFESQIWRTFGHKRVAASDRTKNHDSDPGMTKVYHCNVEIRGDTVVKLFKGPYIENTRTLLQKVVGDDNVLVVKFMGKPSDTKTDFSTYCEHYHKVAHDGILLVLRRYRFFG